jgi:diguanylate cyclase (GGDEF)-like protein
MLREELLNTPEKAAAVVKALMALNKKLEDKIDYYRYDDLTTLMLRKDHNTILKAALRNLSNNDIPFVYANLDINGLHEINRSPDHGYVVGDSYIKSVADDLITRFPNCDIFRIGGDEFAIIMKGQCPDNFKDELAKVANVEYGHVVVNKEANLTTIDSLINYVDDIIKEKKKSSGRRKND